MVLTIAQLQTIKADIASSSDLNALPNNDDGNAEIANLYGLIVAPDFWVWRTDVSRINIYNEVSSDATSWDWTIFKNQGVAEQGAWVQMFMGDRADFSKLNLRSGIGKIFGASNANTLHCLTIGRRKARRIEKVLATGTGSAAIPATMSVEGVISGLQILDVRNS